MATETANTGIPANLLAEIEEAARIAQSKVRDPEIMRRASERMDRTREELRQMSIAVELIRETRGE